MKTKLAIFLLICTTTSSAQTNFFPNRELNYPIWPNCETGNTYLSEQIACSEEAFTNFLRSKINWAEVSTTPISRAQVYLSIDHTGNVSGFGIVDCCDAQLAKQLLAALSQVPNHWLPGNQSNNSGTTSEQAYKIDARIYAELFWSTQSRNLDSLQFYKLIGFRRRPYDYGRVTPIGDFLDYPGQVKALTKHMVFDMKIPARLEKKISIKDTLILRGVINLDGYLDSIKILQNLNKRLTASTIRLLKPIYWVKSDSSGCNQTRIVFAKFVFNLNRWVMENERHPLVTYSEYHQAGYSFPEGSSGLLRFIHSKLEIPPQLSESDLHSSTGKFQLFFNSDGQIYYSRVIKSVHPMIDQRIQSIIMQKTQWVNSRSRGHVGEAVMDVEVFVPMER
ncbi:hypothetical protein [Haliscomenobacter sp.]|uniref:hypothetical protein n=1 Tax=Haliscomenobacter sp. TaxID=2717303 RepID=UPI0035938D5C